MAPLETIWPNELHIPPTRAAWAAMLLCGTAPLTSKIGLQMALMREAQRPNAFGHLLTPQALWGMYVADGEPPNV